MKKVLTGLIAAIMVFSLAACGGNNKNNSADPSKAPASSAAAGDALPGKSKKAEKDWKIALVPKDSTNAWFVRMEEGVKAYAKDTGINAFQKGPAKTDAAAQAQVIQDLIAQGVDALAVVPVDPAALEPVLAEAMKKGIVVVTHEASTQENTMYDIEAFNNAGFGAFIMDNLAAAMGEEGVYTTMVASVTNASHNEWADGAIARQKEKYPKMTLLDAEPRVESEDNQERSYERAKELFKKYPDLKGIVGTSSKDAPGIAKAIEELGLKGKKFTAGTAMPNESKLYLESGSLAAGTLWDPKDAGYAMLTLAAKILRGEEISNGVNLGLKGYEDLQFAEGSKKVLIGSGWVVINKENVNSFGF
ncbi:autoinducer 2 ABC transporter substrate-binding protein [Cohnella sp. WQ 127256]|uniref:autoinducer 2 ABC transporter substrate-binding protein n=1 Tax=Cohnella sp. WQ 127256 TaxID=2938790 RepID=UPI002119856A|nr:autoinducer 2 ABC transporter substrate-binding protein [Cohnella sp. WQ 127256]